MLDVCLEPQLDLLGSGPALSDHKNSSFGGETPAHRSWDYANLRLFLVFLFYT